MFEKEGFAEMYKIICSMISRPESVAFREPVDWKGMGLIDYLTIVKNPMDLGTVKTRIEQEKYETLDEIATDVRLVWRNCMLYNRDGSEVGKNISINRQCHFDISNIFFFFIVLSLSR